MISALKSSPSCSLLLWAGVYVNPALGKGVKGIFFNAVAVAYTARSPLEFLRHLKRMERRLGRRTSFGDRPCDLDILFWFRSGRSLRFSHPRLIIPHPRIARRAFVKIPLGLLGRYLPSGKDPELHRFSPVGGYHLGRKELNLYLRREGPTQ